MCFVRSTKVPRLKGVHSPQREAERQRRDARKMVEFESSVDKCAEKEKRTKAFLAGFAP